MTSGNVVALLNESLVSLNCLKATMGETGNAWRTLDAGLAWRILDDPMDWGVLCLVPWTDYLDWLYYRLPLWTGSIWTGFMDWSYALGLWTCTLDCFWPTLALCELAIELTDQVLVLEKVKPK